MKGFNISKQISAYRVARDPQYSTIDHAQESWRQFCHFTLEPRNHDAKPATPAILPKRYDRPLLRTRIQSSVAIGLPHSPQKRSVGCPDAPQALQKRGFIESLCGD
jgi:hypothetical protein